MKINQKIRIAVDLAMTVLLPLLMAYSLVGEAAHEWMGLTMAALFIMHHFLNYRWFTHLFKGRYTPVRIFGTAVNLLLIVIMILMPVSGIMMSRHIFPALTFGSTALARKAHLLCGYWGFVLMSVHLGIHGDMLAGHIKTAWKKRKTAASSKTESLSKAAEHTSERTEKPQITSEHGKKPFPLIRLIVLAAAAYGVKAFIRRQIGTYLFLQNEFVFFDFDEPCLAFFPDYLAVMVLFACVGYYAVKLLRQVKMKIQ